MNIICHLRRYAFKSPDKTAFIILEDGEGSEKRITYTELDARVNQLALQLAGRQLYGQRVLLIYQDILEFIISFLACQHLGIIPVPVPYASGSKQLSRLSAIITDAKAAAAFCTHSSLPHLQRNLQGERQSGEITIIPTDFAPAGPAPRITQATAFNEIAFIQYTSGSTGMPKGVIIPGSALLHNQQLIKETFGCDEHSVIFSWLPFHHDMGLIGNILHSIYVGATAVLMSPFHFMQRPARWLESISKYRVTHSGGPNFSYDLCVEKMSQRELAKLDLSGWKCAYNGSEPIRAETIRRFSGHFKSCGFSPASFYPCYGLAEATLLVAGVKKSADPLVIYIDKRSSPDGRISLVDMTDPNARSVVGSGEVVPGMTVRIIEQQSGKECGELEEGEIHISGASVTKGYWNRSGTDIFSKQEGAMFLNTGDAGFFFQGQLFINGRTKEMLIIRGENFYPYDIEQLVAECDGAIEANGVVIFGIDEPEEACVIIAEIKRGLLHQIDGGGIIESIARTVKGVFGIDPYDILLTTPFGISRTTSGKLQRVKCRKDYQSMNIRTLASRSGPQPAIKKKIKDNRLMMNVIENGDFPAIKQYLVNLIETKVGELPVWLTRDETEITAMGIDSIRTMELINFINSDLTINLDAAKIFRNNTLSKLSNTIENMLWLKKEQNSGKEIIL